MKRRAHFIISGRVQGVCYRMEARTEASRLGLTGRVRNLPDGRVEVVAEGDRAALDRLLAWCYRGPSFARVAEIERRYSDATGEFDSFSVTF